MNKEALSVLVHWIIERERIRIRKEAGDVRPWTEDVILNEWRFCNVDRCDDRETKWIFEHIIGEHEDSPVLWFNLVIARFINWSPTLKALGYFDEWGPQFFKEMMEQLRFEGKLYTGAYMIPAGPTGTVKHEYLADSVFSRLWSIRGSAPQSPLCEDWNVFLRRAPAMGDFLRNQIITDMKYTHHLPWDTTSDWQTFVLAGPGTQRGLNRLYHWPLTKKWAQDDAAKQLIELRKQLRTGLSLGWATGEGVFNDLNNLANCLCEFDKYERVRKGEGTPRSRYRPAA